jgi:hypothetical protein
MSVNLMTYEDVTPTLPTLPPLHIDSEEAGLLLTLPYRNDTMHLI